MLIVYSSQKKRSKVGILYSLLFYGRLNRFVQLCGFITFLWLAMLLFVVGWGSLREWGTYSYMVSKCFSVLLINKTKFLTHAML